MRNLKELKKVVAVKCFKKKVDGVEQQAPALLLTFQALVLESVKLARYHFRVRSHMCPTLCGLSTAIVMVMEPTSAVLGVMGYQMCVLSVVQQVIHEMTIVQVQSAVIAAMKPMKLLQSSA